MRTEFNVAEAIEIQTRQLKKWKSKLLPHVYQALESAAHTNNEFADSGYEIFRGDDMCTFIENYPVIKKQS